VIDESVAEDFAFPCSEVVDGGTFWERFVVGFEDDYFGMPVEITSMFDDATMDDLSKGKVTFTGLLEDVDFNPDNTVSLRLRDPLTFRKRKIPAPISTDNTIDGNYTATSTRIGVVDSDEFTDPEDWPSKDYLPTVAEAGTEKFIYERIDVTGGGSPALVVGKNRILYSADFSNAVWNKTNLVPTEKVDDQWGSTEGWRIVGSAGAPSIYQTSPTLAAASAAPYGSVWARLDPSETSGTIQLKVRDATDSESATQIIGLQSYWVRYRVTKSFTAGASGNATLEVTVPGGGALNFQLAHAQLHPTRDTIYTPTEATEGNAAGRGAYGTNASSKSIGGPIKEIVEYRSPVDTTEGLHPAEILRDLFNRNITELVNINAESFRVERAFSTGNQFRRTIDEATSIEKLANELREQAMFDIWVTEDGEIKIRQSFRPTAPGEVTETIETGIDIVTAPPAVDSNKDSRITRMYVYFNFNPTGGTEANNKEPDQYDDIQGQVNQTAEGKNSRAYKAKFVFSQWIFRNAEAIALAGRLLDRFRLGARRVKMLVTLQRYDDLVTGETINIEHPRLRRKSGTSALQLPNRYQIMAATYPGKGKDVKVECLEGVYGRFAFIAPNEDLESPPDPFPDYDDASDAELEYAFICRNDETIGVNNDPPYLII
jgi:hypothetical protein